MKCSFKRLICNMHVNKYYAGEGRVFVAGDIFQTSRKRSPHNIRTSTKQQCIYRQIDFYPFLCSFSSLLDDGQCTVILYSRITTSAVAAARCAAAVKYKKPYYFLALDTAWRGDDDGGCDEERRRPRSHSRSNFAFTNIECFAQVLARIYFPLQFSRLLKYFVLSLFKKLKHYLFFAKMIYFQ